MNQSQLARGCGLTPQAIQAIEAGNVKNSRHVTIMARFLNVSAQWLGEGWGRPPSPNDPPGFFPSAGASAFHPDIHDSPLPFGTLPITRQLPVYSTQTGTDEGDFIFKKTAEDYVNCPSALASLQGLFALYVVTDHMEPRYSVGDMIIVHPGRPPRAGDDVLIEMIAVGADMPSAGFIRRLVDQTASKITCSQFNPPREEIIPLKKMAKLYRIIPPVEWL